MSRRVLVTGGSGFLGRHVVARLSMEGFVVDAPGREVLDIAENRFPEEAAEVVVHLAARTFVPDSWTDPAGFYRVNTQGTVNVLDYCRRTGAELVNVSGYCYGRPSRLPIAETEPLQPNNPYAFSKASAEEAGRFYSRTLGVAVTTLRPFNLYGPGQPANFLIPSIVAQALDPATPAIVLQDTTPRRDYVHVEDVAAAICLFARRRGGREVYNVGSGRSYSVAEVAGLVLDAAGIDKSVTDLGKVRPNEIPDTVADISAIRDDVGWTPKVEFADGLARLVASLR